MKREIRRVLRAGDVEGMREDVLPVGGMAIERVGERK
jgi:hypothetical protein